MLFECLKLNIEVTDEHFNAIYPDWIRDQARRHFTPVEVAKLAASYLAEKPGTRVLDIGSGSGKFCMVGAVTTQGHFTGVEYRPPLVELSNSLLSHYRIPRVSFICSNITDIDFKAYDAFYFFNSFQEQIDSTARIDQKVETGLDLYERYHTYISEQLNKAPKGTRLATYWGLEDRIPTAYALQFTLHNGLLKLWKKIG
ncbi:MAG: class I SAM-dependent methyltransferase [Bacteroidia bacterium]